MNVPADCRCCGACCFSTASDYVPVNGADWARLGADAERFAHFSGRGNEAFMRMRDGHCIALEIRRPSVDAERPGDVDHFCTIYERRPQTCRDLGRGTPECQGELFRKRPGALSRQLSAISHKPATATVRQAERR